MNNSRTVCLADGSDLGKASEQAVDECAVWISGTGMNDESRRLVDDDQVVIDMHNLKLDAWVGQRRWNARHQRLVDDDDLPLANARLASGV